jgi:hypothetical protein
MKFNLLALACALMLAFGLSMGSFAGSIADADSDGVPDVYDNCQTAANGPLAGACSTQQDADTDGFGNACDQDFNNDGATGLDDLNSMFPALGGTDAQRDLNCDGGVGLDDLNKVLTSLSVVPGPSGLACSAANAKGTCPPL